MPLNIDAFRSVANTAWVKSRDIVVHGEGDKAVAKIGNRSEEHTSELQSQ